MNIVLWIAQVLVALMFLAAGVPKMSQPIDGLAKRITWASTVSPGLVRFIGISEVLGAVGLILPGVAHFVPGLTVAAALGLALVMVLATAFHIRRHEPFVITVILFALPVFVAIGRMAIPV